MKNFIKLIIPVALVLLGGCAEKNFTYIHPNNADFTQDDARCRMYANGATPMPQQRPMQQSETRSVYGTIYGGGTSYNYSYTETVMPDPYQNMANASHNFAQAMARLANVQQNYELCMTSLGWQKVYIEDGGSKITDGYNLILKDQSTNDSTNYNKCLKENGKNFARHTNDANILSERLDNYCRGLTSYIGKENAREFARILIEESSN